MSDIEFQKVILGFQTAGYTVRPKTASAPARNLPPIIVSKGDDQDEFEVGKDGKINVLSRQQMIDMAVRNRWI